jgi:hypothetical protein
VDSSILVCSKCGAKNRVRAHAAKKVPVCGVCKASLVTITMPAVAPVPHRAEVLLEMIDALQVEAAAIRKQGGTTQVDLHGGERIGQSQGSWLYRFLVMDDFNLRDDTPVQLICDRQVVPGVLVSFRDGVLVLALETDLGPKIAAARLLADDAFLIEHLIERLEKIRTGKMEFHQQSAERVLGLLPVKTADAEPDPAVWNGCSLNPDQIAAVRRSLGSDSTYLWGPPGTGKTTTLAHIVEAHYRAGRSVLLVSNTNIAVDTALEKVAERLRREPDFDQGLVIRYGPVVKEELRKRFGSQVILEEIVLRLGQKLRQEQSTLAEQSARLEREQESLQAVLRDLQALDSARQNLAALEIRRKNLQNTIRALKDKAGEQRRRATGLRADLERAQGMGTVRRLLTGLHVERLRREIAEAEVATRTFEDRAQNLARELAQLEAEMARIRHEINRLTLQTRSFPPESEIVSRLEEIRTRLVQIRERIEAIQRELSQLEQRVLGRCKIFATTVHRTYLGKIPPRQFDTVVIDEASMLMPPLTYYAAGLATVCTIIAGDFRQLPPIVVSEGPLAEKWLKADAFSQCGIPERVHRRQEIPYLVTLRIQYRMREPICAVINDLFYDQQLRSDPSVRNLPGRLPFADEALLFVDTGPYHPWAAFRCGSRSRYNLLHALLVRNLILDLAGRGLLPLAGQPNTLAGAVTPYAAQARLIRTLLEERLGARSAGIAATVHRFQGDEKSIVVFDLADSFGTPLSRFLRATNIEQDGARLINVAVSRARQHLILVANFDYLKSRAPAGSYVLRLIHHFEAHGRPFDLASLLPRCERDWIDALHRVLPAGFKVPEGAAGIFNEVTFYPAFEQDLARSRESVVLASPFATPAGTARWADLLRAAVIRGVRVQVLTRPPEESPGAPTDEVAELHEQLRGLGIAVDLRKRMHEKIAIIDRHILWIGSLNILSHRDTHESMLRIPSPGACREFARFLNLVAPLRDQPSQKVSRQNRQCPKCGGQLKERSGRRGRFLGCSNYPGCRYTEDVE